ncbi:hypothetical protein B0T17DRAFT_346820 [Bombardia bombarda]|uniref:Uncharacterized protein n=1 Tax=Bombardia bombarda TaxID=252184 RepID=A0AA39WHM3_9PEZI|nr:hypothetical protein B0T17DRAFT_346820 [Bombardia bombarda]
MDITMTSTTDDQGDQIDQQLAADLKAEAIRKLNERISDQIRRECHEYEISIKDAWDKIHGNIAAFQKRKRIIFATLKEVEGQDRTSEVMRSGVDDIMPPTIKRMWDYMRSIIQSEVPSGEPPSTGLPSPTEAPRSTTAATATPTFVIPARISPARISPARISPARISPARTSPARTSPARTSPGPATTGLAALPARPPGSLTRPLTAKRSCQQINPINPSARKKSKPNTPTTTDAAATATTTSNDRAADPAPAPAPAPATTATTAPSPYIQTKGKDLDAWEVEGEDFIFQYPSFGPGWFVLRCDFGDFRPPVQFKANPFDAMIPLAMQHYNTENGCKGHVHRRREQYTADEIMQEHGHRVRGNGVNEEWVRSANHRLEIELAKTQSAKKARRQNDGSEPSMFVDQRRR